MLAVKEAASWEVAAADDEGDDDGGGGDDGNCATEVGKTWYSKRVD